MVLPSCMISCKRKDCLKVISIIDNVYSNPDQIRSDFLRQSFVTDEYSYYTARADAAVDAAFINKVQNLFQTNVVDYYSHVRYSTQTVDPAWIHTDVDCDITAIIYLSPGPLCESGTTFYRHKYRSLTGCQATDWKDDNEFSIHSKDLSQWNIDTIVSNVYNRCVVFNSDHYHNSTVAGYGTDKFDSRLFQVVFMRTN